MNDDKETDEHEEAEEDDEAEMKKHMEIDRQKGFYHLIRADGSSKRPEDDYERVFCGDLKVMFEPDIKSEVWRSLQGYKVTFRSCLIPVETRIVKEISTNMVDQNLQIWRSLSVGVLKLQGGYDDVVVLENSETKEEDVKEDESDHNKERYTFEDDDDDGEFDDLD
ncbi:hypothetical protein Tco_1019577 [Tanacetum coccineum]|uniref:DUF4283 domain-containing protein n=1 Tax=Tanacetum coccineum TaxID=301880 RepID=A0ABQ5FZG3_9ASTR